jgi:hypothetical protein
MNRRWFFWQTVGAAWLSQRSGAQTNAAQLPLRTSRLFDEVAPPRDHIVQDVLTLNDDIICLHGNRKTREWKVTVTASDGSRRWQSDLPIGLYSSLGFAEAGSAVLVHAFAYKDGTQFRRDAVFRLLPSTGSVDLIGTTDGPVSARMFCAGDSHLVRFTKTGLQLWRVDRNVRMLSTLPLPPNISVEEAHVDLISPAEIAITAKTGNALTTISVPSGTVRRFVLTNTVITQAKSLLQQIAAGQSIAGDAAPASILAVTGSDWFRGRIYSLVLPVLINAPTPLVAIDASGVVSTAGVYDVNHRLVARKLIKTATSNLGVLYSDGTVAWYATS